MGFGTSVLILTGLSVVVGFVAIRRADEEIVEDAFKTSGNDSVSCGSIDTRVGDELLALPVFGVDYLLDILFVHVHQPQCLGWRELPNVFAVHIIVLCL